MIFISYIFSLTWLLLQNDPEAKRILDKLSSTYNTKVAMEQSFKYTIKTPEEKEQNYEGKVTFKTEMYRIQLHEQEIIFDGKDQYTFLKKQNEIQITRPASTEVKFNPSALIALLNSSKYANRMLAQEKLNGIILKVIDFKPTNIKDNVFKIKLYYQPNDNSISKIEFLKNGNRISIQFKSSSNQAVMITHFTLMQASLKQHILKI
ncbi:MAG: outer membrane lipoprotein carrier protein LolA [Saprospiraceae bacterium]|nr:outer membrane lipoprotein carrier protein LolA [Saprospiraceae bacterium]